MSEASFFDLEKSIVPIAGADVPMPYNVALESDSTPDTTRLPIAVRAMLADERVR